MKKYVFTIKDDQLNIALVSKNSKRVKIKADTTIYRDNIGRIIENTPYSPDEEVENKIFEFLKVTKKRSKNAEIVIGLDTLITRTIEIPFLKEKDLKEYIDNNISKFFTVNMDDYFYDYKIIRIQKKTKLEKKKLVVMLVVVPSEIIKGVKRICEDFKLRMDKISIYPDIMVKLINNLKSSIILDIGENKSTVTIYEDGKTFLYTTLNTHIDISNIEGFDDLVEELEYFTNFYSSRNQGAKIEEMLVVGEFATDKVLSSILGSRLGIKVIPLDLKKWKKVTTKKDLLRLSHIVVSQIKKKELLHKEIDFSNEESLKKENKEGFQLAYLILLFILITGGWTGGYYYFLEQEATLYSKTIPQSNEYIKIQDEINELQSQRSELLSKKNAVETIEAARYDYNKMLGILQKGIPKDITISRMYISQNEMDVSFNIDNSTIDALELIISINNLNYFEELTINDIALDDTTNSMSFKLILLNTAE